MREGNSVSLVFLANCKHHCHCKYSQEQAHHEGSLLKPHVTWNHIIPVGSSAVPKEDNKWRQTAFPQTCLFDLTLILQLQITSENSQDQQSVSHFCTHQTIFSTLHSVASAPWCITWDNVISFLRNYRIIIRSQNQNKSQVTGLTWKTTESCLEVKRHYFPWAQSEETRGMFLDSRIFGKRKKKINLYCCRTQSTFISFINLLSRTDF